MDKRCFKCGEVKPLTDFSIHKKMADGHLGKCKACATEYSKRHRREINPGYYQTYERNRKNRHERQERNKERAKTPKGRVRVQNAHVRSRLKYPEKSKARTRLGNAIRDGLVTKEPCVVCGEQDVHGHHEDYSQPLDVIWLCEVHHKLVHKQVVYNPETWTFLKRSSSDYGHLKTTCY